MQIAANLFIPQLAQLDGSLLASGSDFRFSGIVEDDIDEIEEVIETSESETEIQSEAENMNLSNVSLQVSAGLKRSIQVVSGSKKSKKKSKNARKRARASVEMNGSMSQIPEELQAAGMKKYWYQRYELFSKYDEGIKLDLGKNQAINSY